MDETYIFNKITKCKALVDTATSEAQKEIYQGYLEFWQKKIPKSNEKPDTETSEGSRTPLTKDLPEPEPEPLQKTPRELALEKARAAKIAKKAKLEKELEAALEELGKEEEAEIIEEVLNPEEIE